MNNMNQNCRKIEGSSLHVMRFVQEKGSIQTQWKTHIGWSILNALILVATYICDRFNQLGYAILKQFEDTLLKAAPRGRKLQGATRICSRVLQR